MFGPVERPPFPDAPWHSLISASAYDDFFGRLQKRRIREILDLSAGYDLLPFAAARGFSVTSVDTQRDVLQAAREGRPLCVDRPDGSAGSVLCVGTYSLLPRESAAAFTAEIERVLAARGLALLSFAPLWAPDRENRRSGRTVFDRGGHVYHRDHGQVNRYVVYQTREIETLCRRLIIVSLVTQANGVRRVIVTRRL